MRVATFVDQTGADCVGIVQDGVLYPLESLGIPCRDMVALIERYPTGLAGEIQLALGQSPAGIPLDQARLAAPIPAPRHDVLCVGLNYLEHVREMARYRGIAFQPPEHPVYFSKRVIRAVGHGGNVPSHSDITQKLDYEAELAVVIGKRCRKLQPEEVFDAVFGFTVANDVSARDLQTDHVQYTFSKGLDGFTCLGPWIVTADEFPLPLHLQVISRVNGELRQNGNTSDFVFDIPFMISQLSAGMTLEPGDILLTGTPPGVGMGFQPPRFLKAGDVVECEIPQIGILRNQIQ